MMVPDRDTRLCNTSEIFLHQLAHFDPSPFPLRRILKINFFQYFYPSPDQLIGVHACTRQECASFYVRVWIIVVAIASSATREEQRRRRRRWIKINFIMAKEALTMRARTDCAAFRNRSWIIWSVGTAILKNDYRFVTRSCRAVERDTRSPVSEAGTRVALHLCDGDRRGVSSS